MYKDIVKNTHIAIHKFIIGRTILAIKELFKIFEEQKEKNNTIEDLAEQAEILEKLEILINLNKNSSYSLNKLEKEGELLNDNEIQK